MSGALSTQEPFEFGFRQPTFWSTRLITLLGAAIVATSLGISRWFDTGHDFLSIGLALGLIATLVTLKLLVRPRQTSPLKLYTDHIVLPTQPGAKRTVTVKLEDVLSVDIFGRTSRPVLIISTPSRPFLYPVRAFTQIDGATRLRDLLYASILALPNGRSLREKMRHRRQIVKQMQSKRPIVTYVLLASIIVVFLLERLLGALATPSGLIDMGANAPSLVFAGQWFRLVSANFLHGNTLHLLLNGLALLALGTLLERLMGWRRFLLVYCLSALGGSMASAFADKAAYSVGASTALFGLFGALGYLNLRFHRTLPTGVFQPLRWWGFIIAINLALPLLVPQIDVAAHSGGFLVGVLATLAVYPRLRSRDSETAPTLLVNFSVIAVATIFVLGLGMAIVNYLNPSPDDRHGIMKSLIDAPVQSPDMLNRLAWDVATSSSASSPEQLGIAYRAAARALAREPANGAILDTLATVQYRLGRFDAAVDTERRSLRIEGSPFMATQLARFLRASSEQGGIIIQGDVSLEDIRLEQGTPSPPRMMIESKRVFQDGVTLFAHVIRDDKPLGLLQIDMGSDTESQYPLNDQNNGGENQLPGGVSFVIALIDATGCSCDKGTMVWRFWPIDPRVHSLP